MTDRSKPSPSSVNKIFGKTLPETSSDERDDQASVDEAQHDRWLHDNVPPHHD